MSGRVVVFALGAVVAGAFLGLWIFLTWPGDTHPVVADSGQPHLVVPGLVVPSNGTAEVRSPVSGRVLRVLVYEGDEVQEGQLLAELDTTDLVAELDRIEGQYQVLAGALETGRSLPRASEPDVAARDMAQHQLEQAEAHAEGVLALFERGALAASVQEESQRRLEVARARYETVQAAALGARSDGGSTASLMAQVRTARSALGEARARLQWGSIRAPLSGVVLARNVDPGDTVLVNHQSPGVPLFEIADVRRPVVRAEVPEGLFHLVRPGQNVVITPSGGSSAPALGRVLRRAARVEEGTLRGAFSGNPSSLRVFKVFVELLGSSPPVLALGQSVLATIDTADGGDRLEGVLADGAGASVGVVHQGVVGQTAAGRAEVGVR